MSVNFTIVPMRQCHIEEIASLERTCFSDPWSSAGLSAELENPAARFFVALDHQKVVGYAGMHCVAGEGYLANVAVLPAYRRQGVARALVSTLTYLAEQEHFAFVTLEVRKSNQAAIALYRGLGFRPVGERRGFYDHPKEDALLLTKYFEGEKPCVS